MDKQQALEVVQRQRNKRQKIKNQEHDPIKVVYISNPLKVTLAASEFKERVQQLTGQHSDIAEYMLKKKEDHEMGEEEEGIELPSKPIATSTDIDLPTISTPSSTGASMDLARNDTFPFASYYDTSFTDLCYDESYQLLDGL